MIQEDYVSFETAKLLKEKGFEQECDYATSWYAKQYYKNPCVGEWFEGKHYIVEDIDDKYSISYLSEKDVFIPAPTLQTAMKWLREVHRIYIEVNLTFSLNPKSYPPGYYVYILNTEDGNSLIKPAKRIDELCALINNECGTPKHFTSHEEACEVANI